MRLVVPNPESSGAVRKAEDGDTDVVDTTTLTAAELVELGNRLLREGNGPLYGELYLEHEAAMSGPADPFTDEDVSTDDSAEAEPELDESGMVQMKTIYPEDSEYHGMPGLVGTPNAFLATLDQDLAADGVDPSLVVNAVELWHPNRPSATHYEVGVWIDGRYAKIDLTGAGYRLILGATRPTQGASFSGAQQYQTAATARDLYRVFLEIANERGVYDSASNDCQVFAEELCSKLSNTADPEALM